MAAFAAPLLLAGTAIQAFGAIQQGNAAAASYNSQAQANEYNARIQRSQAEETARQAGAREDLQRRQARAVMGRQLAGTAQAGVGLTGSSADLFRQSLVDAETDALNIRYEGEQTRVGLLNQANLQDWEAATARGNAKTARRAGYLSAAGALASGAFMYSQMGAGAAAAAGGSSGTGLRLGSSGLGLRSGGGLGLRIR